MPVTLVDAVRGDIDSVTSNGIVGNVVDGLGDSVLTGAVGGGGLLAGTPVDGVQGDGALVSSSLLGGDDSSSPSSLIAARCRYRSIAGPGERGRGQRSRCIGLE